MEKILSKIIKSDDFKYISHIPREFLDQKRLENFLPSRTEEKEKKLKLKSSPYHFVIEPTNACNLRCPLCSTGLELSKITKETICNICKNDTHNPNLKRLGDSFSICAK